MSFLPLTPYEELRAEAKVASDAETAAHGADFAGLKSALLGHLPSFHAYMQWYVLKDELVPYVGERAVALLSWAISEKNDCLVTSVYFRRVLIDAGEDLDNDLRVTETEQLLIDWGRVVAGAPSAVPDALLARLERAFNPKLRIILVAYAGMMVATNLVNTVGRIPLDPSLLAYRKSGDTREF